MEPAKPLKPKQINAIKLLATGVPLCQVAEKLEVTTMTLYRWQKLPEFEQKLHSISYSGMDEIAKKLNQAALTGAEILLEVMDDLREPSATRLKAALGALNALPKVNGALERGLQHRVADFDLRTRFNRPLPTRNIGQPNPYLSTHPLDASVEDVSGEVVI